MELEHFFFFFFFFFVFLPSSSRSQPQRSALFTPLLLLSLQPLVIVQIQPATAAEVMSLSWIFEIGCCFCGCDNKEDFSKATDPFYGRPPSNRVIDKQVSSKGYSRFQYKESEPLISSTSCSGYQSYLACTESSDADDERSVDIRQNLRSKLNAVTEEETPRIKQHSNDQVNYPLAG